MDGWVLDFSEIDEAEVALVGGKAAHLAGLSRIDGIEVPGGFCVTTAAFEGVATEAPSLPDNVAAAITGALARLGEGAYAVRSSSTAEDMPTASFAGQHDTYLNVVGPESVLRHVLLCRASLFTDQAVAYRRRNGLDPRQARMAVVVQRMVFPRAAGVLFTADPVTSDRRLASVEASFGLGEALVSGRVNPDVYKVRGGEVIAREIGAKGLVVHPSPGGGTHEEATEPGLQGQAALSDEQLVDLVRLGRRIEAHFGRPQDIEWCLIDDSFQIVQSRPITTLFPIPPAGDGENHVYVSVGHQQMMTDAMRPLGLSVWQATTPRPMSEAGGRLFVDVTRILAAGPGSTGQLTAQALERSDPLLGDALRTIREREGFIPTFPEEAPGPSPFRPTDPIEADPEIVTELIESNRASLAVLEREIRTKTGAELIDFIRADFAVLREHLSGARSMQVIMAGLNATARLNELLGEWLGEKAAADTLTQSVPGNVTAEMGLALLDVADAIRPHPEVVAFLRQVEGDDFLEGLPGLAGGVEARDAIRDYIDRYGMRCAGEIDITRPRWAERPSTLVPSILGNVDGFEPGAGARRFAQGREQARAKEAEVMERLRALPDGEEKAAEAKRNLDLARTFNGYREYPKFGMISRYFIYKQALLAEAGRLVRAGVLDEEEDIFFLRLEELPDILREGRADRQLIRRRRDEFESYRALTPPRAMTSDGEVLTGSYRRGDLPAGALAGLAVSGGTIEGRARVIRDIAEADLQPGDILVTTYTDPSWTPLFVIAAGLVTEVGGADDPRRGDRPRVRPARRGRGGGCHRAD